MVDFIEAAAIPVCMVGLLYALPNTQLTRRLQREGRLHPGHDIMPDMDAGDQCTSGLNFDTLRPLGEVLDDYRRILLRVYDPAAYVGRINRLVGLLDRSGRPRNLPKEDARRKVGALETINKIVNKLPELRAAHSGKRSCTARNPTRRHCAWSSASWRCICISDPIRAMSSMPSIVESRDSGVDPDDQSTLEHGS
jgi:hypothetical protein